MPTIKEMAVAEQSLGDLRRAYPDEWQRVQRELAEVVRTGESDALKTYVAGLGRPSRAQRRAQGEDQAARAEVRRSMASAALKQMAVSAATGVHEGKLRFGLVNGWVAQRLLFRSGLERKPVSLPWFRLLWPLLWQRRFLLPLVTPKGIYCFYSRPLVRVLAEQIGERSCVEIAAGDGTLSRFLRDAGADAVATDDHSWSHTVSFGDDVERQEAREALRRRRPQVVVCSWPPPGNAFEREVFRTDSVETYVVIASKHEHAAGDFEAYRSQTGFTMREAPELSRLVLPPELECAVYVFERRA